MLTKFRRKKVQSKEILLMPLEGGWVEGSRPVKTSPPPQVWMYAEGSTGMENEELMLSDLPALRPTLNFPVLWGSAWAVPSQSTPQGPNCSLARGARQEGVGNAGRAVSWGSPHWEGIWDTKGCEGKEWLTETEIFYSALKTLYPQCLSALGLPASIAFLGKVVILLGVNRPPNDQKSRIPLWYCEALKYFRKGKSEDLFLTCLNRSSVPLLALLSFPPPHPPLPIPGSNPSILSLPNLLGGRQQIIEMRSVASGVHCSSS